MKTKRITLTVDIDINTSKKIADKMANILAIHTAHQLAKILNTLGVNKITDKIAVETEVSKL